jgi:ATP-binding cassette subfamily F protein 3
VSLLFVDDLSLQYGGKVIFEGASLSIEAGDRLGIIGANGTGKSTLMKILVGRAQPDGGKVNRAKGLRLGYLEQEHADPGAGSLLDTVLSTAPGKTVLEERLAGAEAALAAATDPEEQLALSGELSDLHTVLADLETRFAKHEAERILSGLGFEVADFSRPVREFSGGWRMRAALAALLYQHPDVLLLDEPTNHLDMPSVHWLGGYLGSFGQALVLISHDREFLNSQVKRVASLEVEGLRTYRGNYDQYVEQRAQELELLENKQARDEARKKQLEAFVDRFKAKASKARQAQSRVRMIEKLQDQAVELPKLRKSMTIKFKPTARSGDTVLNVEGLSFGYSEDPLFSDLSLQVRRGDRLALVGRNGAGKTTLLKLLAGELSPDEGTIKAGTGVTPSYFAQHHADVLNGNNDVLTEVWSAAPDLSQTEARAICGAFLFSGDDVEKSVSVLSGGEKARVALARMLASPGNLLLLDEPTNHLDLESATKLTASLESYDGTLLFVSHNLDFARRLSNKVWDVHDGLVEVYPGSLADYLDHLAQVEHAREADVSEGTAVPKTSSAVAAPVATGKEAYKEKREREAEERKKRSGVKRRLADVEAKIAALESEQVMLEALLADPATHQDPEKSRASAQRYQEVKSSLEAEMSRWEQLTMEVEALGPEV